MSLHEKREISGLRIPVWFVREARSHRAPDESKSTESWPECVHMSVVVWSREMRAWKEDATRNASFRPLKSCKRISRGAP